MQPYGAFTLFFRWPEGVQGRTEGNVSPVGCPPKAEMTRSSGKQPAECTAVRAAPIVCPEESPPACIGMCQPCRKKFPAKGLDAPTTARVMGLPPRRGIVLSFDAKESTKESQRHGDSGKKALIAHFGGGARYVARNMISQISPTIRRAPNSPFSAVKMGGPFSLRCLSPPSPPRLAWGMLRETRIGMLRRSLGGFATRVNKSNFFLLELAWGWLEKSPVGWHSPT